MVEYKIGIGNQKVYETYDRKLTKKLEKRLLEADVSDKLGSFDSRVISLLERRYFKNNDEGNIQENVPKMFARIAANIAYADVVYGAKEERVYDSAKEFYNLMISRDFIPNSPTLMNAGAKLQQLSACFVLPIKDDMRSILGTQRDAGMVHKSGGGTGFDLSEMRMANDIVSSTYGLSSGPVRFLSAYDATTHAVNQGGTRRGANMGIMVVDHPDIIQFINLKTSEGSCSNFNLSVSITDDFMKKVENDEWYTLRNPRDGVVNSVTRRDLERIMTAVRLNKISVGDLNFKLDEKGNPVENVAGLSARFNEREELQLRAVDVFNYVVECAWKLGDPGVIFIDRINRDNPTPHLGNMRSTNPCGEQPLLPYEACCLGSINLLNFVKGGKIDKKRLEEVVKESVHFLDNVIDMSKFPLERISEMVHKTRKIGLGVMGWADALIEMKIAYDSPEAIELAKDTMEFINETAKNASAILAEERGVFPEFKGSVYENDAIIRNATRTTIAPTGTISHIAGHVSSGIEPNFDIVYTHTDADGNKSTIVSPTIKRDLEELSLDTSEKERILEELEQGKKLGEISGVPEEILRIYKTAATVPIEYHIKMQAAFQEHVNNAVSKTINLPFEATKGDIRDAYLLAYKLGCKGITIYRDGSRARQILTSGLENKAQEIVLRDVDLGSKAVIEGHDTQYYKIQKGDSTFHVTIVGDFWKDEKSGKVQIIPSKIFQNTKPLGREESTEFAQSGLDRTGRLKSDSPDWADMIREWKSVTGDKIEGIGPTRINSPTHGVALAFEHYCLSRGVVEYDPQNFLRNVVDKRELTPLENKEEIKKIKKSLRNSNGDPIEQRIFDNIHEKFDCPECHSRKYHKESGCSDPICSGCGWSMGKCG